MTWGTYYFFYECPQCGKKYRYELEGSADEEFGFCPECHVMGTFVGETKDNQQGEDKFAVLHRRERCGPLQADRHPRL
ncbi:hypothetical protein L0N06_17910, partial [Flavonifractor plautii]|uniref:hypothetical protein n=1 Tax=Flavonifractor plautii TaxID=292800 RepID=UPI001EDF11A3